MALDAWCRRVAACRRSWRGSLAQRCAAGEQGLAPTGRLRCLCYRHAVLLRRTSAVHAQQPAVPLWLPLMLCRSDDTYVLMLEVLQLMLVCSSTQLYSPSTSAPAGSHPLLEVRWRGRRAPGASLGGRSTAASSAGMHACMLAA